MWSATVVSLSQNGVTCRARICTTCSDSESYRVKRTVWLDTSDSSLMASDLDRCARAAGAARPPFRLRCAKISLSFSAATVIAE